MTGWSREWVAQKYGSSGFSVGNSVPADRRVTPPTELTGGPRRVCPRQAAPAVLPSRTRSGGSRSRVGPDDGSPSQQGFTPRRGERSSGALDREGTGCRQLGAGRLGQRAVGASLRPWSDPGQVTHGEPGSAQNEVWMWAALLALTLPAAVQALTGHDHPHRAHGKRLRRELITIPARVVHHARRLILRLAPDQADGPLIGAYHLLHALPGPAGWTDPSDTTPV